MAESWGPCPHCGETRKWKYSVNVETGLYNCFVCGAKGRAGGYGGDRSNRGDVEAEALERIFNRGATSDGGHLATVELPPTCSLTQQAERYLERRKIDAARYGIREGLGFLSGYIVVPFPGGEYWVARRYRGKGTKYNNPLGGQTPLYAPGFTGCDSGILVEGVFDAIALDQLGLPAYALCGKALSQRHLEDLRLHHVKRCIVCLDLDAPGAAVQILRRLFAGGFDAYLGLRYGTGSRDLADLSARTPDVVRRYFADVHAIFSQVKDPPNVFKV